MGLCEYWVCTLGQSLALAQACTSSCFMLHFLCMCTRSSLCPVDTRTISRATCARAQCKACQCALRSGLPLWGLMLLLHMYVSCARRGQVSAMLLPRSPVHDVSRIGSCSVLRASRAFYPGPVARCPPTYLRHTPYEPHIVRRDFVLSHFSFLQI